MSMPLVAALTIVGVLVGLYLSVRFLWWLACRIGDLMGIR